MAATGTSDTAKDEVKRYEALKAYRGNFERIWTEIAQLVLPRGDNFITKRAPGQKREDRIFDSTAQLALPAFASAMESMLTPRTQKWHGLLPAEPTLMDDREVRAYLEQVRDLMFRIRYAPFANFSNQSYENYVSLGAFGTGVLFVQDALAKGIRYQCIPLDEVCIAEDSSGVVDTIYRKYRLTARQAAQKWAKLPDAIESKLRDKPDTEFDFLHVVRPNADRKVGRDDHTGMEFAAFDICIEGNHLLEAGGFHEMPYCVSRYVTAPREVYGRSPAFDALADIKTLNEMSKTGLRYGQLVTDAPWITADLDGLNPLAMRPGAINAGYMSEQGVPLAKSLHPEGDPRFSLEMMDQRRQAINRGFLVTLFQILVDTPQMTATEALLRAQEKGALLAPTVGRQQSEFLGPLIRRELGILKRAGALPPPPLALVAHGRGIEILYDSPLSRAQRAEEGVGIMRTIEAIPPLANIDQSVLQVLNAERTFRRLADINGAPLDILNSPEELAAKQQQAQQQQQLANLVQAGPAIGDTVKSLSDAASQQQKAPF